MADDIQTQYNIAAKVLDRARELVPGAGLLLYEEGRGLVRNFSVVAVGVGAQIKCQEGGKPDHELSTGLGRIR